MQKKLKKIQDPKMISTLFWLCFIAYFTSYLGRLNYSSAMPQMIREGIITVSQAGAVSMAYFFSYGIGQFCNGILADKLPGRLMIFAGLFLSGIVNILMGFGFPYPVMITLWCLNGYVQAMIWPPVVRIFAEMLPEERRVALCVHITATMPLGTLVSYLLSAGMLSFLGWRFVFFGASVCLCLCAVFFLIRFGKVEQYAELHGSDVVEGEKEKSQNVEPISFSTLILKSGILVILLPVLVHGVLKDGVTSWVPTYISESFSMSTTFSILITTVLPIVNITGAYAAKFVYNKFFQCREIASASFFFLVANIALLLLWKFSAVSAVVSIILLSVITSSMMAVNTLFVNLLPMRFENTGRVSSMSGFLNATAYLGSAISTFTIGILVQSRGWSTTIFSWLFITIIAMVICILVRKKEF